MGFKRKALSMDEKKRVIFLITIMSLSILMVFGVSTWILYRAALTQQKSRLTEIARNQAQMIDVVYRLNEKHEAAERAAHPGNTVVPKFSPLSIVTQTKNISKGLGESGEIVLGAVKDGRIEFLVPLRHAAASALPSISFAGSSRTAQAMRLALLGQAGTIIALDYRDVPVLAAYQPVHTQGWGVVAKIDISEIHAPFLRAGEIVGAMALFVIFIGAYLFRRVINPMVQKLETTVFNLGNAQRIAHIGNWEWDVEAKTLHLSDEAKKIIGLPMDEALSSLNIFVSTAHPKDKDRVEKAIATALESIKEGYRGYFNELEYQILHADGTVLRVVSQGEAERSAIDGKLYMRGIVNDITERKKSQIASQRLSKIIERSLNEIYVFDAETFRFTDVNLGARRNLGYTMQELAELTAYGIKPEIDKARFIDMVQSLMTGSQEQLFFETVHQRKDGSTYDVEIYLQFMHDEDPGFFVAITNDITDRKRAESEIRDLNVGLEHSQQVLEQKVLERTEKLSKEIADRLRMESALRRSQQRTQAITSNLFEGIIVADKIGHIIFSNSSAEAFCGLAGVKVAGTELDEVVMLHADHKDILFQDSPWCEVTKTGVTIHDNDAVFVTKTGDSIAVDYACSPLIENDKIIGCIISFRDISELKAAQQEALQASKLASVGQLAAGIAHEVNTPTQYIGDNLRFIESAYQDIAALLTDYQKLVVAAHDVDSLHDLVAQIEASTETADLSYLMEELPMATEQSLSGVEQVSRIVQAMKEFSHPGSDDMVLTDLNGALKNTLTVCCNEWKNLAESKMDFDKSLPLVTCFPGELNQVFLNLIVNAAQAIGERNLGEKGEITLSTRQDNDWVEIRVSDTGAGIPEDIRPLIFDPFFTTKGVGKGTGQGLSICHDVITKKHGGTLTVETEIGIGSTFILRLPVDGHPLNTKVA